MKDETYKRLRHEPESWTKEVHTVEVYVGTGGEASGCVSAWKATKESFPWKPRYSFPACMWGHRSGEFYKERPVVVYEYQKGRDYEKPLEL